MLDEKALAFDRAISACLAHITFSTAGNVVRIGRALDRQETAQAARTTSATRHLETVIRETVQSGEPIICCLLLQEY